MDGEQETGAAAMFLVEHQVLHKAVGEQFAWSHPGGPASELYPQVFIGDNDFSW